MCTSICLTRFKPALTALLLSLMLAGCASDPQAEQAGAAPSSGNASITQKLVSASVLPSRDQANSAPSVLIRGKTSAAIMNSIVKYRAKRGMKVIQRERNRLVLSKPVPDSDPPADAQMVFSLKTGKDGTLLSARILRVSKPANQPTRIDDVTDGLRDQLEQELARYAR